MKQFLFSASVILLFWSNTYAQNTQFIRFDDRRIAYEGRIGHQDTSACVWYWSGTSATLNFKGTGLSVLLQDEGSANFYEVIVDGRRMLRLHPDMNKQLYTLAQGLPEGKHTIELFKDTEFSFGSTRLFGFQLAANTQLLSAPKAKKRKIEFYGNSITCGYAIEDTVTDGNSSEPKYEYNYLTYGAITARHFNAAYHCISKSGIGITVGFTPYLMPEIYDRTNPADSNTQWDFSSYTPKVVVINLGQNDASVSAMPNHPNFKARFGTQKPNENYFIQAYQRFFRTLRLKYPSATLIAVLGDMSAVQPGSPWPAYVQTAVANQHDRKLFSYIFKPKKGYGHPLVKDDAQMANELIGFIDTHVKW